MNLTALLSAIAIIESSDAKHPQGNDLARGKRGEVSRYQIMPATWKRFGGGALANARDPKKARTIANRIVTSMPCYQDRTYRIEDAQVLVLAITWNRGPKPSRTLYAQFQRAMYKTDSYERRVLREYQAIVRR